MIHLDDIHSVTDFQRNTRKHIAHLKESGRPEVLTVNGRAEIVVQDAQAYQALLDTIDHAESLLGIRLGLESMRKGTGRPVEDALQDIRRKHGIPAAE